MWIIGIIIIFSLVARVFYILFKTNDNYTEKRFFSSNNKLPGMCVDRSRKRRKRVR